MRCKVELGPLSCWLAPSWPQCTPLTGVYVLFPDVQMRVVARLSYASTLEARQHSLLPSWQWPTWLMFWTWLTVHIYSFIRYNYYGGSAWYTVILWVSDAACLRGHACVVGWMMHYPTTGMLEC